MMNNHGFICKNNTMIIFLIIFTIIILILLNKKIKLDIDFSVNGFEYNFCVKVNYFFEFFTLYKEDFFKYKDKVMTYRKENVESKLNLGKWILEYFDVERIAFDLKIGLNDVFVTSMAVPIVSSVLSILIQKYFNESSKTFSVKPIYNKLFLGLKGAVYITVKFKDVIYIIFRILKDRKNERIKKGKKSNTIFDKDFMKT